MNDSFTNADEARKYVLGFGDKYLGKKISYCDTSAGRRINFYDMSDEDAILVANMLRQDIEIPSTTKRI